MYTFENRVGRLCELRITVRMDASEVAHFQAAAASVMLGVRSKVIFCSDLRRLDAITPNAVEPLIRMLRTDNPKIDRNAVLVRRGSLVHLQMQRIVEDSQHIGRRVFYDADSAPIWLASTLSEAEYARLKAFIAEG